MEQLSFRNRIWVSRRVPAYVWILAIASFLYLLLQILIFVMEGISLGSAVLALIALVIFVTSFSALRNRGAFVEADAVLSIGKTGSADITLEYPGLTEWDPQSRTSKSILYSADGALENLPVTYDKKLGQIEIHGMADRQGKAAEIRIYRPASLEEIIDFLERNGISVTEKED